MIPVILTQALICSFFGIIGYVTFRMNKLDMTRSTFYVTVVSWGIALIEICFTLGLIYVNSLSGAIDGLLKINFYGVSIIGICVGLGVIYLVSMRLMSLHDEDTKWGVKWTAKS